MRRPIVAGNWKMNKTPKEGVELINEMLPLVKNVDNCDIVVCVPAIDIYHVGEAIKGTNIKLGAQNVHYAEFGAFTGEISAEMLTALGVEYVIIGHSERRIHYSESNRTVNKRTLTALKHGLKPIICVGETLYDKKAERTGAVLTAALTECLEDVEDFSKVTIAYEPYWAIGTGKTPTLEQITIVISFIRDTIAQLYGERNSDLVRILYGGSVNPANADEIFSLLDVDGGLVGGASLKPGEFSQLAEIASKN